MRSHLLTVLGILALILVTACSDGLTGQAVGEKTAVMESAEPELLRVSNIIEGMVDINSRTGEFEKDLDEISGRENDALSLAQRLLAENTNNTDTWTLVEGLRQELTKDVGDSLEHVTGEWDSTVGQLLGLSERSFRFTLSLLRDEEPSEEAGPVSDAAISSQMVRLDGINLRFSNISENLDRIRGLLDEVAADSPKPQPAPGMACPMKGTEIVFESNRFLGDRSGPYQIDSVSNVWKMDSACNTKNLTADLGGSNSFPVYSPDGSKIAFGSDRDGNQEIYVMDADGKNPQRMTYDDSEDLFPTWSPDGTKIAFTSARTGGPWTYDIYVINVARPNNAKQEYPPTVVTPHDFEGAINGSPDWSPRSDRIAIASTKDGDYEIYVMDIRGENVTRLTNNDRTDYLPQWSPDGTKIAFTSVHKDGNKQVWVVDANDPADLKRVTSGGCCKPNGTFHDSGTGTWSPDGKQIAFASSRDGEEGLYVMDAAGENGRSGNVRRLTTDGSVVRFPNWSPLLDQAPDPRPGSTPGPTPGPTPEPKLISACPMDNTEIVFGSNRGGSHDIWKVNSDCEWTKLTKTKHAGEGHPVWSPDGTKIAFGSNRDGNREIYVMDADGKNPQRMTFNNSEDSFATWSRSGRYIAFTSARGNNGDPWTYDIHVVEVEKPNNEDNQHPPAPLTEGSTINGSPDWSPTSDHIAFASTRDGDYEIYVMDSQGQNVTQITNNRHHDYLPQWSPDGKQIAFTSVRDEGSQVWVVDVPSGENLKQITPVVGGALMPSSKGWGNNSISAWSPDGSRIVFTSDRDGNMELYTMDTDGGNVLRLTEERTTEWFPNWSPSLSVEPEPTPTPKPMPTPTPELLDWHLERKSLPTSLNVVFDSGVDGESWANGTYTQCTDTPCGHLDVPTWSGAKIYVKPEANSTDPNDDWYYAYIFLDSGQGWAIQHVKPTNLWNGHRACDGPSPWDCEWPDMTVTIGDDDQNVKVSETGSTSKFTLELLSQPSSEAVLSIVSDDKGEVIASPATLTFMSPNWDIPQTVTLTGVDDNEGDGDQTTIVTVSGVGDNWVDAGEILLVITEDDEPTDGPTPPSASNLTRIAFQSGRDGNNEIYVMNADGSGQTRLTNNRAADEEPSWSPDGAKIAFESRRDGNTAIYVMNADGSNQIRLTSDPAGDEHPSWSPDGAKLTFTSNRDGNKEIYVMDADGSNQVRLTNNEAHDEDPSWSPDGKKIVFSTDRDGKPPKQPSIYVMDADGSNQTLVKDWADRPSWSPDGAQIFYTSSGTPYVMNANGDNPTSLANASGFPGSWSPDGTKLTLTSHRDGNPEIYVMDADGENWKRLTDNLHPDYFPSWGSGPSDAPAPITGIVVTNLNDSGPGSLRQAISDSAPGGTITFGVTGTIALSSSLRIYDDLSILGPAPDPQHMITISGEGTVGVFLIEKGAVSISNVSIYNGAAYGGPGNDGSSKGGGGGGGGGGGFGGGIFNRANLIIDNVVFLENLALGGNGGRGNTNHGSFNGTGGSGGVSNVLLGDLDGGSGGGGEYGRAGGDAVNGGGGGGGSSSSVGGKGGSGSFGGGGGGSGAKTAGGDGSGGGEGQMYGGDGANGCCSAGAGGGGGAGLGGAIFNDGGELTITRSRFISNHAAGGSGGGGGFVGPGENGQGVGGAIFNNGGSVFVMDTAFCENRADTDTDIYGPGVIVELPESCPAPSLVVTSLNDSGPGSLRQAILDSTGESITFDVTGTISLTSTIHISNDLVIQGPGSDQITISGNNAHQVFDIIDGKVLISDVTIANGMAYGGLGNDGSSSGGGGGGGGGGGFGGGIFNQADLVIIGVVFMENQALGGTGGRGNTNHGSFNGTGGDGGGHSNVALGNVSEGPGVGGGYGLAGGDAVNGAGGGGGSSSSVGGKGGSGSFGGGGGGSGAKTGGGNGGGGGKGGLGGGNGANGCCSAGAGGGGGAGLGGAIFNDGGTLDILESLFTGNRAAGGSGGGGGYVGPGSDGQGIGGAIYNVGGTVWIGGTAFCENIADADTNVSGPDIIIEIPGLCSPEVAPSPPNAFTGTVMIDSASVKDGTKVVAMVDGKEVAATTTTSSSYGLTISAQPDELITFNVEGQAANESAKFVSGESTVLNLTFNPLIGSPAVVCDASQITNVALSPSPKHPGSFQLSWNYPDDCVSESQARDYWEQRTNYLPLADGWHRGGGYGRSMGVNLWGYDHPNYWLAGTDQERACHEVDLTIRINSAYRVDTGLSDFNSGPHSGIMSSSPVDVGCSG